MKPKFKVGQTVKDKATGEEGQVLSFTYHSETGFVYQVSSKEVDVAKKEIIEGIKHCSDKELEAVK